MKKTNTNLFRHNRANPKLYEPGEWVIYVGTLLEHFDMYLFIHMAAILATVFMPGDPSWKLKLQVIAVSAGYGLRIVGGFFWGWLADVHGRTKVLKWTMLIMGFCCFFVAFSPSFNAIGYLASGLFVMCRLGQGFACTGEIQSSVVFLAESTEKNLGLGRDQKTAYIYLMTFGGSFLALTLVHSMSSFFSSDIWWRVAYAVGGLVGLCGYWARRILEDVSMQVIDSSDSFATIYRSESKLKKYLDIRTMSFPARYSSFLKSWWAQIVWLEMIAFIGCSLIGSVGFLFGIVFIPFWFKNHFGYSELDMIAQNQMLLLFGILTFYGWIQLVRYLQRKHHRLWSIRITQWRCLCTIVGLLFFKNWMHTGLSAQEFMCLHFFYIAVYPCSFFCIGTLVMRFPEKHRVTHYGVLSAVAGLLVAGLAACIPFATSYPFLQSMAIGIHVYCIFLVFAYWGFSVLKKCPDQLELKVKEEWLSRGSTAAASIEEEEAFVDACWGVTSEESDHRILDDDGMPVPEMPTRRRSWVPFVLPLQLGILTCSEILLWLYAPFEMFWTASACVIFLLCVACIEDKRRRALQERVKVCDAVYQRKVSAFQGQNS